MNRPGKVSPWTTRRQRSRHIVGTKVSRSWVSSRMQGLAERKNKARPAHRRIEQDRIGEVEAPVLYTKAYSLSYRGRPRDIGSLTEAEWNTPARGRNRRSGGATRKGLANCHDCGAPGGGSKRRPPVHSAQCVWLTTPPAMPPNGSRTAGTIPTATPRRTAPPRPTVNVRRWCCVRLFGNTADAIRSPA